MCSGAKLLVGVCFGLCSFHTVEDRLPVSSGQKRFELIKVCPSETHIKIYIKIYLQSCFEDRTGRECLPPRDQVVDHRTGPDTDHLLVCPLITDPTVCSPPDFHKLDSHFSQHDFQLRPVRKQTRVSDTCPRHAKLLDHFFLLLSLIVTEKHSLPICLPFLQNKVITERLQLLFSGTLVNACLPPCVECFKLSKLFFHPLLFESFSQILARGQKCAKHPT